MFNWYTEARGVGKTIFPTRVIGSAIAAIMIFLYKGQVLDLSLFVYSYIVVLLVYPFIFFYLYKRSFYDRNLEMNFLLMDLLSVGICASLLDFAIVPSLVFLTVVLSTTAGLNGAKHFLKALAATFLGAIVGIFSEGYDFQLGQPSLLIEILAMLFLLLGMTSRNYFYNIRTLQFRSAKQEIAKQKEEIENNLQEKEILLREVHHRVKNNLQLVYSLLNLQQEGLTDPSAIETVSASKQRIKIISLVHEALYKTDEARDVDIDIYLTEIVRHTQNLTNETDELRIESRIQPVLIDLTKAVPLGLIINEIISNSIKHAFNADHSCKKVSLIVESHSDQIELRVSDNGKGFVDENILKARNLQSLGLSLIKDLVRQLKGELEIESTGGASYFITFPLKDE